MICSSRGRQCPRARGTASPPEGAAERGEEEDVTRRDEASKMQRGNSSEPGRVPSSVRRDLRHLNSSDGYTMRTNTPGWRLWAHFHQRDSVRKQCFANHGLFGSSCEQRRLRELRAEQLEFAVAGYSALESGHEERQSELSIENCHCGQEYSENMGLWPSIVPKPSGGHEWPGV